jgi:hypothetical protein
MGYLHPFNERMQLYGECPPIFCSHLKQSLSYDFDLDVDRAYSVDSDSNENGRFHSAHSDSISPIKSLLAQEASIASRSSPNSFVVGGKRLQLDLK